MSNQKFPYTLGYENNPILPIYNTYFFEELRFAWRKCIAFLGSQANMLWINEDSLTFFFSIPEISYNLLLFLDPKAQTNTLDRASQIIYSEFLLYLQGGHENMKSFCFKKISGTDILLWSTEYTQNIEVQISHPNHDVNSVNSLFWDVTEDEWFRLYEESFRLLKAIDPGFFSELSHLLKKVVPYWISIDSHNSCSHQNIIGNIYASYPIWFENPEIAVMEALIHEYNHNKMNLIMRFDHLINNDRQTNYYSPYRPDARHIHGIYLWLHAMVAVYYIMLRCFRENIISKKSTFYYKTIVYVLKNQLAINTLNRYGKFTPLWEEIFEDMKGVHKLCLLLLKSMEVDKQTLERCRASTREHFYKAKSENKTLFY
jgi:hypothetical protein